MKFKKFKHDLQKDNLVIPSMSDELKTYSEQKEYYFNAKITLTKFNLKIFKRVLTLVSCLILVLTISIISLSSGDYDNIYQLNTIKDASHFEEIINFERQTNNNTQGPQGSMGDQGVVGEQGGKGDKGDNSSDITTPDYSSTNIQEENVDEADIVKTDGESIFYLNEKANALYKYNTENGIIHKTNFQIENNEYNNHPTLYITDKYVIVIQWYMIYKEDLKLKVNCSSFTVYDKETLEIIKNYKGNGIYKDSRLINGVLYFVYIQKDVKGLPSCEINDMVHTFTYSDIQYSTLNVNQGFTFIVALDTNTLEINTNIHLGVNEWDVLYMTEKSLYLSSSMSHEVIQKYSISGSMYSKGMQTNIFRYELNGIEIKFSGLVITQGEVENQFYLDEYNNYLRVVLSDESTNEIINKLEIYSLRGYSKNKLFKKVSYIDKGIGEPGETIESVRFEDNSCLIVTYLKVINRDPLYYIDLTDQYNPKIISGYKEPNYNTYLHYINDNYALGFGVGGMPFWKTENKIYFGTNKLGLYDIKNGNVNKLDEIYLTHIDVVSNHKALYIEKEVFGFPGSISGIIIDIDETGKYIFIDEFSFRYGIYTIDYDEDTPKIKTIRIFQNPDYKYERMIRIDDKYYLVSQKYIEILDSNFNDLSKINLQ